MEILNRIFSARFIAMRSFPPIAAFSRLAMLLLLFVIPGSPETHGQTARDTDLKAVFLFNFAHFVDWPPDSFATNSSPIVIGILGEDPFGPSLDEVVSGETIDGRPIVIERYRRLRDLKPCHILYVSESMRDLRDEILAAVRGKPVLTVGETEAFATSGGIIRFDRIENRITLVINNEAAKAVRLRISSQVLRAARIVETAN